MTQKTKNSYVFLLILVAVLSAFGPFVTDFYLPALPALTHYFNTTASAVQLSLTFGMIGLAGGQLFIGPLSDKYGRKKMLLASLILFLIATVATIITNEISIFLFLRLLQGAFGAGAIVISKSIATDLYDGKALAKFFSVASIVQGLAPIFAPVLGGFLLEIMDWKGIFFMLFLLALVIVIMLFFFKESLSPANRVTEGISRVFKNYGGVLKNKQFMLYVAVQSFAMGTMFTYISASPFIFQEHYGVSPLAYSICFGANGFAIMMGSLLSMRFQSIRRGMGTGSLLFWIMSLVVAVTLLLNIPVQGIEMAFFLQMFCLGLILPTSMTLALNMERENSGNASAILGFLTFLAGGIVSPLTGLGNMIATTAILITMCSSLTLLTAWIVCGHPLRLSIIIHRK